ncbi:MAG: site-specific integrase, partial [Cytophagaceae bacterium]
DEAQTLMHAADAGSWRAMISVAIRTGLRLGEKRALTVKDIEFERYKLQVRRTA